MISIVKRGIPVMSYQFKKKIVYEDGTEHLVSEPLPVKLSLPGYPVIRKILELRSKGDVEEIRRRKLPWKLGKLCIMHRLYVATYFIKEHFKGVFALLMSLVLFLLNVNVVYYTSHTIPLLGLAMAFSQGSFFPDPSYCQYVDTVLRGSKCVFVAPPGLLYHLHLFLSSYSNHLRGSYRDKP